MPQLVQLSSSSFPLGQSLTPSKDDASVGGKGVSLSSIAGYLLVFCSVQAFHAVVGSVLSKVIPTVRKK